MARNRTVCHLEVDQPTTGMISIPLFPGYTFVPFLALGAWTVCRLALGHAVGPGVWAIGSGLWFGTLLWNAGLSRRRFSTGFEAFYAVGLFCCAALFGRAL